MADFHFYSKNPFPMTLTDFDGVFIPSDNGCVVRRFFSSEKYNTNLLLSSLLFALSDSSSCVVRNFHNGVYILYYPFLKRFVFENMSFDYVRNYLSVNDGFFHICAGIATLFSSSAFDSSVTPSFFDSVEDAILFIGNSEFNFFSNENVDIFKIVDISFSDGFYTVKVDVSVFGGFLVFGDCCFPDFIPIVKALGGFPATDQPTNLKMICQLLGVDTNTTLDNCDAMKEYLKRIVQILGGSPFIGPNDNLKSICKLLGIDSNENGLTDCELSKDYVKRISKMLGAE